jgi:hypothetical protein
MVTQQAGDDTERLYTRTEAAAIAGIFRAHADPPRGRRRRTAIAAPVTADRPLPCDQSPTLAGGAPVTSRKTGTLHPHEHASAELGWSIEPDPDADSPFRPSFTFAATEDLKRAGIVPASGVRLAFGTRALGNGRCIRAVDIEPEQISRLHGGNGIAGQVAGIYAKNKREK